MASNYIMRRIILSLLLLSISLTLSAQTARQEIDANPQVVIPSMTIYNGDIFTTEAPNIPEGFEPIYMTGYLRHGSRYEASKEYAIDTYIYFKKADEAGILTPLGKEVYKYMEWNHNIHQGRVGDLTDTGYEQHKQLGIRYYKGFPMLFTNGAKVNCISSTSLRATFSMVAFNEGIKECNPLVDNHMNASKSFIGFIRPQKSKYNKDYPTEEQDAYEDFLAKEVYPKIMDWGLRQDFSHSKKALFTDPDKFFAMFDEHPIKLLSNIYKRLAFAQNLGIDTRELVNKVFSADERYNIYKIENCRWHYRCGSAAHPLLANNMAQSRIFVDHLAAKIDNIVSGNREEKAHLIFGHDFHIIPLFNIFGLERMPLYFGEGKECIDYVTENWRGYKITPKASNIIFILYGNKEGKVLVRIRYNERDVELPIESETPHLYDWNEVKSLAYSRLAELDRLSKQN